MKFELVHPSRCTGKLPEDFEKDHLIAEEKLDGSRYVLYLGGCPYSRREGNTLLSRRESISDGKYVDRSDNVPHITSIDYGLDGTILDGEIMSNDFLNTNSIMNSLPKEAQRKQEEHGNLNYFVFDILFFKGKDIRSMPLSDRRKILEKVVDKMGNDHIKVIPQIKEDIPGYFQKIIKKGGEGLIIKDLRMGYGSQWAKMKKSYEVSCIVSGYKKGTGKYADMIGSLALSVYKDGKLIEVGFASGFDDKLRIEMSKNFQNYEGRVVDIFTQEIQKVDAKNPAGRLRHPTFFRFRDDLTPKTITSEKLFEDLKATKTRSNRDK